MNGVLPRVPPEIWAQIFSNASLAALAACAQASHQLFDLTVPCLWSNVEMIHLVMLLPKESQSDPKRIDTSEVPVPLSPSTGYFDRLNVYAADVRTPSCLTAPIDFERDLGGRERAWLTTTLATLTQSLLPNVTTLTIASGWRVNHIVLDWVSALVFPAQNLARCYLNMNLCNAVDPPKNEVLSFLSTLLSSSPHLVHLELSIAYPWSPGEHPWACFNPGSIPHHLTDLTIRAHNLDSNCLSWIAQMSRLNTLRICVPNLCQPAAQIPRFERAVLPAGAFSSLRHLELYLWVGFRELFSQLWSTPIVTNLTRLSIRDQSRTGPGIFPIIVAGSPRLQELQLGIIITGFKVEMLVPLRSLPLRALTISGSVPLDTNPLQAIGLLWPALEDLCLQRVRVNLVELPNVFLYLPRLKRLFLAPPNEFSPEVVAPAASYRPASRNHLDLWRSRSLNFVVNYRWANRVGGSKADMLAR